MTALEQAKEALEECQQWMALYALSIILPSDVFEDMKEASNKIDKAIDAINKEVL